MRDLFFQTALRAAAGYREKGDADGARAALWFAGRAIGVEPVADTGYADLHGCVHFAKPDESAFAQALTANLTY
jgi:hypothetical protein